MEVRKFFFPPFESFFDAMINGRKSTFPDITYCIGKYNMRMGIVAFCEYYFKVSAAFSTNNNPLNFFICPESSIYTFTYEYNITTKEEFEKWYTTTCKKLNQEFVEHIIDTYME